MAKFAIGVDFGTESGRAIIVDVADGRELAAAVHVYANGVIDEKLPGTDIRLEPDWALQDPNDYLEVYKHAVPAVLRDSGVEPADVIGIGIDFTACTMLPTTADGTPLCFLDRWRRQPHAWVKLWKHHAAQPEANALNRIAAENGFMFLERYGGKTIFGVVLSQGLADPERSAGRVRRRRPAARSGRLGRLAAHRRRNAQRVYRRL